MPPKSKKQKLADEEASSSSSSSSSAAAAATSSSAAPAVQDGSSSSFSSAAAAAGAAKPKKPRASSSAAPAVDNGSSSSSSSSAAAAAGAAKPKKPRAPGKTAATRVNERLQALGIAHPGSTSACLRRGLGKGLYGWKGGKGTLDDIVWQGGCIQCGSALKATVRLLLNQPDYGGGDYDEGSEGAPLKCGECEAHMYITRLCAGAPRTDSGKGHNHCTGALIKKKNKK